MEGPRARRATPIPPAPPQRGVQLELVQAVALVAALVAAGPAVRPAVLAPGELAGHLGQTVRVAGTVVDVEPGDHVHRVTLLAEGEAATVLAREDVPPLGARAEAVGDAAADRGGAVVWADTWRVDESPGRAPVGVERLARQAPERAGGTVTAWGTWRADAGQLVDGGARLDVTVRAAPPPDGEPLAAWGHLAYEDETAGYRLHAVGWEPWTPSPG